MIVESEKSAQSMPRNTGPRFPALAVVCNGLLSIAKQNGRVASTTVGGKPLVRKAKVLAGAPGFM